MEETVRESVEDDDAQAARRNVGHAEGRMESWWGLASIVCLIVAVPCLLTGQLSAAFVVATLGVVAWFLNVRSQLKRAHPSAFGGPADETDPDEKEHD